MKTNRLSLTLLATGLAAVALTGCYDEPTGESTKVPVGTGAVESPQPGVSLITQTVTVDANTTYQEMEGFGASDCWLGNWIGSYWTANRDKIATLLFSQNISTSGECSGIGLSMWRVNLGAGTAEQGDESNITANNRAESYLGTDGNYDWTKCAGQRFFMEKAKENNVENFVLFSNSPLVQYTVNGKGYSDNGSKANLKADCYKPFAEYMATVAEHFVSAGYNISHISPVNEPQNSWGGHDQEGSSWQNSEIAQLAKDLDASLTDRNLSTGTLLAEASAWDQLYSGNSGASYAIDRLFNPSSSSYVGDLAHVGNLICGHSYWSFDNWDSMRSVRSTVASQAKARDLRVWQTEWSMLDDCPSELGGDYEAISELDIAMYMAKIIHNDITVAGCSSWSYWTALSVERYGQKNRFELIKTTPAGGEYSDDFTAEGKIEVTPNLWVLGNYSLFVRPGYKRVQITHNESKDFFASAYVAPDNSRVVVVYGNFNKEKGISLDATLNLPGEVKSVQRYTTSETKNLLREPFNIKDQVWLDPYSISTMVYNL